MTRPRLLAAACLIVWLAGCAQQSEDLAGTGAAGEVPRAPGQEGAFSATPTRSAAETGSGKCVAEPFEGRAALAYDWPFPGNGNAEIPFELPSGALHVDLYFNHTSPTILFITANDNEAEYDVVVVDPGGAVAFDRDMFIEGSTDVPQEIRWEASHTTQGKTSGPWALWLRGRGMAHLEFEAVATGERCE